MIQVTFEPLDLNEFSFAFTGEDNIEKTGEAIISKIKEGRIINDRRITYNLVPSNLKLIK